MRRVIGKITVVKKRTILLFVILTVAIVAVALRVFWLQCVDGAMLSARMSAQVTDFKEIQSPRGNIYDRSGRALAVSIMTKSLCADPREINQNAKIDLTKVSQDIAGIIGGNAKDIYEKLDSNIGFVWLKRKLDPSVSKKMADYIKDSKLHGLFFVEEGRRYYPNDSLAAQVLGFVGTDENGLEGLELMYDDVLRSEKLSQKMETDSLGMPILNAVFNYTSAKKSKNLYLTIDTTMQFIVEQAMDKSMALTKAKGMTVIVMDPKTGEILVMANRPTFNVNNFYQATTEQMKNRAVSIIYEPGSTFKTVTAAAVLNEGLAKPNDYFYDSGNFEVLGRRIRNWGGDAAGSVTFTYAVEQSLNTVFAQLGLKLGKERMNRYMKDFGFGQKTGIELPGEEMGILFDVNQMTASDLASVSIGHGIAVTPIQLVTAVSAMANGGNMVKPHIIKEIRNSDGTVDKEFSTEPIRNVITKETEEMLVHMLESDIERGGGNKAKIEGYTFAGKTGTAEKLNDQGTGYAAGHYIPSFVGFGPVEDPQFAVIVIIDDPSGVYYGGQIAAPVFADFMAQIVRYKGLGQSANAKTDFASVQKEANASEKKEAKMENSGGQEKNKKEVVLPPGKFLMPDLQGKTMRQAGEVANAAGLKYAPDGTGVVIYQSIPAGTAVEKGMSVSVFCENR